MIKHLLATILLSSSLGAQEVLLWPNGAPGSEGKTAAEKVRLQGADHVVSSIHKPSLTLYLPAKGTGNGAAVIIAPGGGHRELWIDHEGYNPAQYFRDQGIAAFVLKYRLATEDSSTYTVDNHAVVDMQRAIRVLRANATAWGIDTARIGVMGFSAGGEVAALSAMRFDNGKADAADPIDRLSSHPAFQALIYPGNSQRFTVSKASPPVFIAAGYGDRADISKGMAELYLKYKEVGVPAELHMYAGAGHGFGMRSTNRSASAGWPVRLVEWMTDIKMSKAK